MGKKWRKDEKAKTFKKEKGGKFGGSPDLFPVSFRDDAYLSDVDIAGKCQRLGCLMVSVGMQRLKDAVETVHICSPPPFSDLNPTYSK